MERSILSLKTTAMHTAKIFLDHWFAFNGNTTYIPTGNSFQFHTKLCSRMCVLLRIKHFTKTTKHLETNVKAERLNKTTLLFLRHYVAKHGNTGIHFKYHLLMQAARKYLYQKFELGSAMFLVAPRQDRYSCNPTLQCSQSPMERHSCKFPLHD